MDEISQERAKYLAQDFSRGFIDYCKFKVDVIKKGYLQSSLDIGQEHRQQDNFVHAGVMATMADHSAGYAGFTLLPEDMQILTVEFKINFLSPAFGEALVCKAFILKGGRQLMVAESYVYDRMDAKEKLAAKSMVTLMPVAREKLEKFKKLGSD